MAKQKVIAVVLSGMVPTGLIYIELLLEIGIQTTMKRVKALQ